jgi:hypothetical protein
MPCYYLAVMPKDRRKLAPEAWFNAAAETWHSGHGGRFLATAFATVADATTRGRSVPYSDRIVGRQLAAVDERGNVVAYVV